MLYSSLPHVDYVDYTDNDNQWSAILFLHKINNICSILLQVDYVDHDDDDNQYWTILFLHKINNLYSTTLHFPRLNNCEHLLFSHRKELNVVIMVITLIYAGCYICYIAI